MPQILPDLRDPIAEPVHSPSEPENPHRICHGHLAKPAPAPRQAQDRLRQGAGVQAHRLLCPGQVISESMPHMVHTKGAGFLPEPVPTNGGAGMTVGIA